MNRFFETRYGAGVGMEVTQVAPHRERLWALAFGVETLDGLFDCTTAANAIPLVDAALLRFNHDPEPLREVLDPSDHLGMYGNRASLEAMRRTLADHDDATISGLIDPP